MIGNLADHEQGVDARDNSNVHFGNVHVASESVVAALHVVSVSVVVGVLDTVLEGAILRLDGSERNAARIRHLSLVARKVELVPVGVALDTTTLVLQIKHRL